MTIQESRIPLVPGDRPRLERLLANLPPVSAAYVQLQRALQSGRLAPVLRARIALMATEAFGDHYCLSRAVAAARAIGLTEADIADARQGWATERLARDVLAFAEGLVYARGEVTDAELNRLVDDGLGYGEIVEIAAAAALAAFESLLAEAAALLPESPRVVPYFEQQ